MWGYKKTHWDFISETLEKTRPSTALTNVKHMTELPPGAKIFAWVKMTLMEKVVLISSFPFFNFFSFFFFSFFFLKS